MSDEYIVKKNPSLIDIKVIEDIKAEIKDNSFEHIVKEAGWDDSEEVICAREVTDVIRLDTLFYIIDKHIGK